MKTLILLAAFCSLVTAQLKCDNTEEIACSDEEKCIPHRYICDFDNDCDDSSDESSDLCEVWRNSDECERNEAQCRRNGETSCVSIWNFCTLNDPPCEGDLDRRLCQMLENGRLQDLSKIVLTRTANPESLNKSLELEERFNAIIPHTLRHNDCPTMYTRVGDQCISIFHIGSMSWSEARSFCNLLEGDLMTFRNVSQFEQLVQHLQQYDLTADFWIGGSNQDPNRGWEYVSGRSMPQGSPYWATRFSPSCVERNVTSAESEKQCYQYIQAPSATSQGHCVSLSFEHYYLMTDENCLEKKSPICVI